MVKLSEQLQVKKEVPTRTERLIQRQEFLREEEKKRKEFEELKARAEAKKEELQVTSIEEYRRRYDLLDPKLKPFFETLEIVEAKRTERINTTKLQVQERQEYADQRIARAREIYERRTKSNEEWYRGKKDRSKYKERYLERERKYEDDYEEEVEKWDGYKQGLKKGLDRLNKNEDISFSDIKRVARELGRYEEAKMEAKNEQRKVEAEQLRKLRVMKAKGYKPVLIERADIKERPEAVELGYFDVEKDKWVSVTEYKVKPKVDISKAERIGFTEPQERVVVVAGEEFKFKTRVPIYKETATQEVVTPYARTGFTEKQLIKQQQDITYGEWEKERKISDHAIIEKAYVEDEKKGLFKRYVEAFKDRPKIEDDMSEKEKKIAEALGKYAKLGFKWVDDRVHWDTPKYPSILPLQLKFGKIEDLTDAEKGFEELKLKIDETSQNVEEKALGKENIERLGSDLETKYQEKYQEGFEDKYMKSLIYDETTFEKASEEYAKSDEAKELQESYQKEYEEGYEKLGVDAQWKLGKGFAQTGLGLSKTAVNILSSPLKTGAVAGGIYAGVGVLKAIPTGVGYGISAGFGVYGAYKFLDPKSTYTEKAGGLLIAGVSTVTLGYGAYKYLKSPVIKTIKIKPPKATLRSAHTVSKDIKLITKQGSVHKVVYENQKLLQIGKAGRRTTVTTKGRALFSKVTKIKLDPIYKGVPTQQLGKTYTLKGLRGSYHLRTKASGYQKATKLLKNYGWTDAQAKATLRYYQPKVVEQYMRGERHIFSYKGRIKIEVLTKQKVYDVNKALGIKTRGAKTIKDIYKVNRKIVDLSKTGRIRVVDPNKAVGKTILEKQTITSGYMKGNKFVATSVKKTSGRYILSRSSDLKKGYYPKVDKYGKTFEQGEYRDLYAMLKKDPLTVTSNLKKKIITIDYNTKFVKLETTSSKIFQGGVKDLTKIKGVKYAGITKTPFSKTFGYDPKTEKLINQINKKISTKQTQQVIKKITEGGTGYKQTSAEMSKYWGKGQYERTVGGLDIQQGLSPQHLQQTLKSSISIPEIKIGALKDIINIKQSGMAITKNMVFGQLSQGTIASLKLNLKLDQKPLTTQEIDIKNLIKHDVTLKYDQAVVQKTSPALKSALKSALEVTPTNITSLSLKTPTIPRVPITPIPKPFIIPFLKSEISKKRGKSKVKSVYDVAYLPDFTTRAVGLKPETLSEKQARAKLKKLLTGLEIRKGVILK